jgi:hypothetical protein
VRASGNEPPVQREVEEDSVGVGLGHSAPLGHQPAKGLLCAPSWQSPQQFLDEFLTNPRATPKFGADMAGMFGDGIDRHEHNRARRKHRLAHGNSVLRITRNA